MGRLAKAEHFLWENFMPVAIDPAHLSRVLKTNPGLAYRMRGLTAAIGLPFLDPPVEVAFDNGRVTDVRPLGGGAQLQITGPDAFFEGYMAPFRRPGFESLTAGLMHGVQVAGADAFTLHSYTGAFDYLLEAVRQAIHGSQEVPLPEDYPFKDTDNAVGRYRYVTTDGVEMRMYYEESGSGAVPLLLQHTAGADSRQYRHILADPEIQKNFRIIAYDLPYHGRSLPPEGIRWWEQDYRPTKHSLMNTIVSFAEALELDRPIFLGCSIGGNLALDLAAHHKDSFRALIALNGLYCAMSDQPTDPPSAIRATTPIATPRCVSARPPRSRPKPIGRRSTGPTGATCPASSPATSTTSASATICARTAT